MSLESVPCGFAADFVMFCILGHAAGTQAQTDVRTCTQQHACAQHARAHTNARQEQESGLTTQPTET